jgi:biopolymer transport protein ExbB/TolQ
MNASLFVGIVIAMLIAFLLVMLWMWGVLVRTQRRVERAEERHLVTEVLKRQVDRTADIHRIVRDELEAWPATEEAVTRAVLEAEAGMPRRRMTEQRAPRSGAPTAGTEAQG